ncbi:MAG: CDP-archaeol synthase [Gammaproteobacteria bacterium]|nr:CDP-archaeol synthase [Gammaproteobacteria bacterium]MBU1653498.1 CDP-archaeol synthase [Gammaproteobacteria bacterium]MBU1962739.1 CDP-archaeol synthase [Gammaproteobacteria bacterium]
MFWSEILILLLVTLANGAPILAHRLLGDRLARPLDGGLLLADGRPLLGSSKTIRGLLSSLAVTPLAAMSLGLPWELGLVVAAFAMLGDLCSSFLKRRMGLAPSSMALGLDQVPESLFPILACREAMGISWMGAVLLALAFVVLELVLSQILFHLRIRNRPY